jgi:FtsP/CotA-like multicopper oxidase with cupredoxin domain
MKRRQLLKLGLAAAATQALSPPSVAAAQQSQNLLQYLCSPDGLPPDAASPPSQPFLAPLFVPPIKQPITQPLEPPPDPSAHQRYNEYPPKKFYVIKEQEFLWKYHPQPPYGNGSWSWGFDGMTPGPTYHARYGEPILVRMVNNLPPVGKGRVGFACPNTTTHLHNAHTASESDGFPMDFIGSGEFWDHHYANFPSRHDPREKLTTLWYHDHMMDFTTANTYAGLTGFFLLFDEEDSNNENDPNPCAFRLPSGKYDVPLILHDVRFDQNGQVVFNKFDTKGLLGDKYTVNRTIQPYFQVERRKYRFRILNGGPSRFYQVFLSSGANRDKLHPFVIVTGDGNFQPRPVCAESIYLSVAQRVDVIIDFAQFKVGDQLYLQNRLEQTSGQGPTGRVIEPGWDMVRFDVIESTGKDNSRIPDTLRDLPQVGKPVKERLWTFDYRGGCWTINGKPASPDMMRIDAEIVEGTGEKWILRNEGKNWSHPIHSHFTEFLLLSVDGRPVTSSEVQTTERQNPRRSDFLALEAPLPKQKKCPPGEFVCPREVLPRFMGGDRRDVATLLPDNEIAVFMDWSDFHGRYVMHCHNVVHEDHAMMIRWDILPASKTPARQVPCEGIGPTLPCEEMGHEKKSSR